MKQIGHKFAREDAVFVEVAGGETLEEFFEAVVGFGGLGGGSEFETTEYTEHTEDCEKGRFHDGWNG